MAMSVAEIGQLRVAVVYRWVMTRVRWRKCDETRNIELVWVCARCRRLTLASWPCWCCHGSVILRRIMPTCLLDWVLLRPEGEICCASRGRRPDNVRRRMRIIAQRGWSDTHVLRFAMALLNPVWSTDRARITLLPPPAGSSTSRTTLIRNGTDSHARYRRKRGFKLLTPLPGVCSVEEICAIADRSGICRRREFTHGRGGAGHSSMSRG